MSYSLRKSRKIRENAYSLYRKKGKKLSKDKQLQFENNLRELDLAIEQKNRDSADVQARNIEQFTKLHFKKTPFDYVVELFFALLLALLVATIVRQMWFELYEIPTGSMRPTFREQDHLTVSKLPFGINVPLKTEHFYFDPSLVQRTSVVIFTGDKIPFIDSDTTYFGLFPYKKRYIKRNIGKPGDTLYFYGGKIYGFDKEGNEINELVDSPWMQKLEHIPFLNFEGRISASSFDRILFHQMNQPVGRLTLSAGAVTGQVYNGEKWVKDNPEAAKNPHKQIETYSDLWGMQNFAMARLLTKEQVKNSSETLPEALLYLELRHHPSLNYPKPSFQQNQRGFMVQLTPQVTLIPLQQKHLDALMENMYTARFVVKDGHAQRYSLEEKVHTGGNPSFPGVADGTYEFYFGQASRVRFGGILEDVPADSPLYSHDPANVQKLFNLGIEMDTAFSPKRAFKPIFRNAMPILKRAIYIS